VEGGGREGPITAYLISRKPAPSRFTPVCDASNSGDFQGGGRGAARSAPFYPSEKKGESADPLVTSGVDGALCGHLHRECS